jgi:hypothetical protein
VLNRYFIFKNFVGRYTLVYLNAPVDAELAKNTEAPLLELTYNWDTETYASGRNFSRRFFCLAFTRGFLPGFDILHRNPGFSGA